MIDLVKKVIISSSILVVCLAWNAFSAFGSSEPRFSIDSGDDPHDFTPEEPRVVTIGNLKVKYIESGTGQAVVLLHGNAGGVEDFEYGMMENLARDHRVIAIDRPGHGGSDRPKGKEASVEFQAKLLHETLLNLGITRPTLVGHSWGGSLALCYTLKYPDDVAGLVLLAPAAYPDDHAHVLLRAFAKTPVLSNVSIAIGKALFGHLLLKQNLDDAFYPQRVPTSYLKMAAKTWLGNKQLRAYLEDQLLLNDSLREMKDRYSEINIPVIIITGDKDKVVRSKDNAYRLQKAIPGSRLIELKDTGHEIPMTRPDSIYEAMTMVT